MKIESEINMKGMLADLLEVVSEGKLLAVKILLTIVVAVGITLALAGKSDQAIAMIVPAFLIYGLLFAIKRRMGIFGVFLDFD